MLLARKGVLGYFHVCSCLHSSSQHAFSSRSAILWLVEPLWGFVNHKTYIWNCHGQLFCSFWRIHGNFPQEIFLWADRLHIKNCSPVGKSHLPKGKMASVTAANSCPRNFTLLFCGVRQKWKNARKFVLHVPHDYFNFPFLTNDILACFVALCYRSRCLWLNSLILRSTTAKLTKT